MQREVKMKSVSVGLRVSFFLLAIGMLLYVITNVEEKDADIIFIVGMTTLTFPIGLLVTVTMTALLGLVLMLVGIQFDNSIPFYLVIWSLYAVTGYLQWFHVLPSIRRKRAASRRSS